VRIGGALATFDRFLQFDTLSVNLDPTSVSSSSADAAALQSVSDEMTRLLNQFPDQARSVADIAASDPQRLNTIVSDLILVLPFSPGEQQGLRERLP
jgi:Lon protease-like protein